MPTPVREDDERTELALAPGPSRRQAQPRHGYSLADTDEVDAQGHPVPQPVDEAEPAWHTSPSPGPSTTWTPSVWLGSASTPRTRPEPEYLGIRRSLILQIAHADAAPAHISPMQPGCRYGDTRGQARTAAHRPRRHHAAGGCRRSSSLESHTSPWRCAGIGVPCQRENVVPLQTEPAEC